MAQGKISGERIAICKALNPTWGYAKIGVHLAELDRRRVPYTESAISGAYRRYRKQQLQEERSMSEQSKSVPSTSDERTVNNTMRHQYRVLTDAEKTQMQSIKDMGLELLEYCDTVGSSREMSLAKTKIEEAVMWAVKHVTR